jgi:hypothetical protein
VERKIFLSFHTFAVKKSIVMEKNNLPSEPSDADQLKKYADDLIKVYQSEKQKRKELQAANEQLVKFAGDLNKTFSLDIALPVRSVTRIH